MTNFKYFNFRFMKHLLVVFSVLLVFQLVNAETLSNDEVSLNNESVAQNSQSGGEFGREFEIVQTQLTKSEMWINAKEWISSSFKDYKHTVDMEDKESGTIILKFAFYGSSSWDFIDYTIKASLKIDVRDNKYRYTFSDVTYSLEPSEIIKDGNYTYWSSYLLETSKSYLEAARAITNKGPIVDSSLQNDVKNYKTVLDNTIKYKNEKDAKKNKFTKEYMKANSFYELAQAIESGYTLMRDYLVSSLKEAMVFEDDF